MANNKKYEMLYALRDELNALLGEDETNAETTAEAVEADYDDMSFNELKKLCKSKGLSAKGNREELIARLSGDEPSEEEEPVEEKPKRGRKKKSEPEPEEEEDSDDEDESDSDEDEDEEDEEDDIQSQVEAATEDMSLEELAEFCKDNGLSPKGKRPALISRIVKAVEAGDIELADDDEDEDEEEEESHKKSKKSSKKEETEDEDSPEVSEERAAALKAYKKDTEASFKKGELERDDLVEFLCDFYDKDKKTYKKASDKEILSMYIEASSNLIDDDGDIVEEGAYTVNGVPYCCGRPLSYDEDEEQYMCEHCGNSYEADED